MLLSALVLLGSVLQTPQLPAVPAVLRSADVTVVLEATGTHFAAQNLTGEPQLLLFLQPEQGLFEHVLLVPGESLVLPIPEGADGFLVEVADGASLLARSTGTLAVDDLRRPGAPTVWTRRRGTALEAVTVQSRVERHPVGPTMREALASAHATHVPTPVPTVDRKKTKDKLDKRSLPPV